MKPLNILSIQFVWLSFDCVRLGSVWVSLWTCHIWQVGQTMFDQNSVEGQGASPPMLIWGGGGRLFHQAQVMGRSWMFVDKRVSIFGSRDHDDPYGEDASSVESFLSRLL